jgi:hypothetical protein
MDKGMLCLAPPSMMSPRRCSRPVQRLGVVLAVSSLVLAENKTVVAIMQHSVKHLALSPILQVAA